ncbi:MAG: phosphate signaling complex protein PhoU [Nostocoides sp.]
MRDAFQQDLRTITDDLVEMTRMTSSAIGRATTALMDADVHLAEAVIEHDREIDALREQLDNSSVDLLALQQPVASDLRVVVTSMRMSSDLERMGDLARHVAKVARLRYPESAVPAELRATFLQMGQIAERIVTKAGSIIAARDVAAAVQLEKDDDEMDALHRDLYRRIRGGDYSNEQAVDLTLLGRYYERFADHAVSIAERVVYLVTGSYEQPVEDDHSSASPA